MEQLTFGSLGCEVSHATARMKASHQGTANPPAALSTTHLLTKGSIMARPILRTAAESVNVAAMFAVYETGKSLAEVATVFGITRQRLHYYFNRHGLQCRPKTVLPAIEFNGNQYTVNVAGYYRRTDGERTLLHRDMWEHFNGAIPENWDVHHKDENKQHNEIANFECLPKDDHARLHNQPQAIADKHCEQCGAKLVRRTFPRNASGTYMETPAALAKRRFCNSQCASAWRRGKPR